MCDRRKLDYLEIVGDLGKFKGFKILGYFKIIWDFEEVFLFVYLLF